MGLDDRDYMRNRGEEDTHYYNPKEVDGEFFLSHNSKSFSRSKGPWFFVSLGILFGLGYYFFVVSPLSTELVISSQQLIISPLNHEPPQAARLFSNITEPTFEKKHVEIPTKNSSGVYKCVNSGHVTYGSVPCASGAAVYQSDLVIVTHTPMARSVALMRGDNGVYNLSGNVNGFPVDFILDTGAAKTTISGTTAYQMGIHSCQVTNNSSTANGLAGNCSMVVSKLSVGDFVFSNVTVNIAPNMQGNSLIGNDLLSELKVEQHNGEMTLSK